MGQMEGKALLAEGTASTKALRQHALDLWKVWQGARSGCSGGWERTERPGPCPQALVGWDLGFGLCSRWTRAM